MDHIWIIIAIAIAGPIIGSLIGVIKKPSESFMYNMLAFAAGVMLSISFLELIPESIELSSTLFCIIGIIAGSLVMYTVDRILPHIHPEMCRQEQGHNLKKTASYLIIGIFIHNFPEGIAMAIGSVSDFSLSVTIAIAIAIHDIPEGICTSAPYYFVSKNRIKSFLISASTAIPTIIGFILAYYLFRLIPLSYVGILIAATAGIMIYISCDELVPCTCSKKNNACYSHSAIFSLIAGVVSVVVLGML